MDRRIDRLPVPLDELALRVADIIALDGHGVGLAGPHHRPQRRVEIADTVGECVVRIVRKYLEQRVADDVVPPGEGRARIGVVDIDDVQARGRIEQHVRMRRGVELRLKLLPDGLRVAMPPPAGLDRRLLSAGQRGFQQGQIAPRRLEQALQRAPKRGLRRFVQQLLKVGDVLFADEPLHGPTPKLPLTVGIDNAIGREILPRSALAGQCYKLSRRRCWRLDFPDYLRESARNHPNRASAPEVLRSDRRRTIPARTGSSRS